MKKYLFYLVIAGMSIAIAHDVTSTPKVIILNKSSGPKGKKPRKKKQVKIETILAKMPTVKIHTKTPEQLAKQLVALQERIVKNQKPEQTKNKDTNYFRKTLTYTPYVLFPLASLAAGYYAKNFQYGALTAFSASLGSILLNNKLSPSTNIGIYSGLSGIGGMFIHGLINKKEQLTIPSVENTVITMIQE